MRMSRHESAELRWEMATRDAHPRLLGYVQSCTGYTEWSTGPAREAGGALARGDADSEPCTRLNVGDAGGEPARHTSFVAALHDRQALVEHDGFQEGGGVSVNSVQDGVAPQS